VKFLNFSFIFKDIIACFLFLIFKKSILTILIFLFLNFSSVLRSGKARIRHVWEWDCWMKDVNYTLAASALRLSVIAWVQIFFWEKIFGRIHVNFNRILRPDFLSINLQTQTFSRDQLRKTFSHYAAARCQFHQHFTSSFFANILSPENYKYIQYCK